MPDIRQLFQDAGAVPLGDLIAAIGRGVAEAQAALDAGSIEQTLALYDQGDDLLRTLRELGYRPTFYTIPETEGELKLSLSVAIQDSQSYTGAGSPSGPSTPAVPTPPSGSAIPRPGARSTRSTGDPRRDASATPTPPAGSAAARLSGPSMLPTMTIGSAFGAARVQPRVYATPVDGRYQNSFSFTSQVSATVKFKIVAIPPSTAAEAARVVPNLIGMEYASALALAASLDLGVDHDGAETPADDAIIAAQSPSLGDIVAATTVVKITLSQAE